MVPWFMPLLAEDAAAGPWYLADDFAFCERVRRCQFRDQLADSSVRLWCMGRAIFWLEDAGSDKQEYASYIFHLPAATAGPQAVELLMPMQQPTQPSERSVAEQQSASRRVA